MLAELDLDTTRIFYADFQRMMTNPTRYAHIGRHLRPQRLLKRALTLGSINLDVMQQKPPSPPARVPPRREATVPNRLSVEAVEKAVADNSAPQARRKSG